MKSKDNKITDDIVEGYIRGRHSENVIVDNKGLVDLLTASNQNQSSSDKPTWPDWLRKKYHLIQIKYPQLGSFILWFNIPLKKGTLLIMILLTVLCLLTYIVLFSINVVNDVILYESDYYINEQGTFNPQKAIDREYALFLFNTSEVWANPGIQINKDDRYRINISGGYNSSIRYIKDSSFNNLKIDYPWIYIGDINHFDQEPSENDTNKLDYCLSRKQSHLSYNIEKAGYESILDNYGNILYTIQAESSDISNHPLGVNLSDIKVWNAGDINKNYDGDRKFHRAQKSGYLYFSINDVIFDNVYDPSGAIIESALQKIDSYSHGDSLLIKKLQKDHFSMYNDNLGQLLVSVEIIRKNGKWYSYFLPMSLTVFREFEYRASELLDGNDKGFINYFKFICLIVLFLLYVSLSIFFDVLVIWTIIYIINLIVKKTQLLVSH